jgi:hypothetical protein
MNDELTDSPSAIRRATDIALLVVAFAAVASWVWRRLRRPVTVDAALTPGDARNPDDNVSGTVGSSPGNAPV